MHVVKLCRGAGPIVLQVFNLRQVSGVDQHESGERTEQGRKGQQNQHHNAAGHAHRAALQTLKAGRTNMAREWFFRRRLRW